MRRRWWRTAALTASAVTGALLVQGATGRPAQGASDDGKPPPVETSTRTARLSVAADGTSARLGRRDTAVFSLLGLTWSDPSARVDATIEARTRDAGTGMWSTWRTLEDGGEGDPGATRGGTEPVWAGASDGVEVRVDVASSAELPEGLRLDMVDPGTGTVSGLEPTAFPRDATESPSTAPKPPITSRAGWGADESISPQSPAYLPGGKIKAVTVHHTVNSNDYTCDQAPAVVRGIYAYHVKTLGWKDIGYNFLVDKCGTVYEGRKGGVGLPVLGAHTYGFNGQTTGVSVLGTYTRNAPSTAAMTSVARLAAWKLGLYGVDPNGTTTLTAGADGKNYFGTSWTAGTRLTYPTIIGHRDGYNTECPGEAFYAQLPAVRAHAADPAAGLALPPG
ncbi:N-acetylmuramoyl-L-alanine amidase [Streptomyces sp. RG80]|uniref:peptidoglycan recognition protein family protein n=1 Tax=Streptomyces sp. RG80 TaxID=3157340 RepID=UPI00338EBAE7